VILLLSTADTDLLAASAAAAGPGQSSTAGFVTANPARLTLDALAGLLGDADVVVLRLLGGRDTWPDGVDAVLAAGRPAVVLGGEATPDAGLMALSTVPAGVAADAFGYLREGGPENLRELANFLSDTLLLTGHGFAPPRALPSYGVHAEYAGDGPVVAVVFYRAHEVSGNTAFIDTLCDAIVAAGGVPLPVYCASLRDAGHACELRDLLGRADVVLVTVLAAGGAGDGDWDAGLLAELDVPLLQGLCLTSSRAQWAASNAALAPIDAAMQVAIPEFDGRLITVPFSFKEEGPDGIPRYVADPERAARLAGLSVRHARLASVPNGDKRVAIMLSSYPTKHSRVGNAVGLDTPASAVALLRAMRAAGYELGDGFPEDGDQLIHALIAAGGHDTEWLTDAQMRAAFARTVPFVQNDITASIATHWGPPPGSLYVDEESGEIVLAALRFGNVVLMIQPPRGFGENPVAIYHDPDLPPSHHYLAAYRWLDETFGVDAIVHLGKHGTLEWLPGKGLGLSAECFPDAVLGSVPLVYPFIVNDPGEGTQAKRRGHAVIVDHLVPPMARADTYGDLARLEQLLDEYATVAALDPSKLPTLRAQIWTLLETAHLHQDLGVSAAPDAAEFDDFVLHIDGYLCEVKDAAIRDGLHVLGLAPSGEALINLVLVILRAPQLWSARWGSLPGLRDALGLTDGASRGATDGYEQVSRALVEAMADSGWDAASAREVTATVLASPPPATPVLPPNVSIAQLSPLDRVNEVARVLEFACAEVVPRLRATTGEIDAVLHALNGGYIPAGPSGSPTRGLVNVLPTGRNFYSVDPKAIPSRTSWDTGRSLADSLLARHLADEGSYPRCVGLTVWGTSAMRTQGDDIAEILALIGCRPEWDDASRRVTGFSVVPAGELGRPRIDVTVRISGFFRDAFPHVVALLDDAICTVAELEEPADVNFLRAHALADSAEHGDWRRATTRIFGSKPGAYGAGLLPLIDARNWRDDADLAEVYAVWGGYAYGRDLSGVAARADMEQAFRRIAVAAKNTDTREHDIADSDDYFQYHGGMIAMVRTLTGRNPAAYIGDSAVPDAVKTRTLAEETRRVFRSRVVNPRWIAAMRRHGYKGAFELAATVDYLFGYDATAGVVADWMYEQLSASYVFDEETAAFMRQSNPWALRGITERLLEAASRGLWESPDAKTLDRLRQVYLDMEGDLEGPLPGAESRRGPEMIADTYPPGLGR